MAGEQSEGREQLPGRWPVDKRGAFYPAEETSMKQGAMRLEVQIIHEGCRYRLHGLLLFCHVYDSLEGVL